MLRFTHGDQPQSHSKFFETEACALSSIQCNEKIGKKKKKKAEIMNFSLCELTGLCGEKWL